MLVNNTDQSGSANSQAYPSDTTTEDPVGHDINAANESDSVEVTAFQQTQSEHYVTGNSQSEPSSSTEPLSSEPRAMAAGAAILGLGQTVLGVLLGTAFTELMKFLRGPANSLTEEDLQRIADVVHQELDAQALEEFTALTESIKTQMIQYS